MNISYETMKLPYVLSGTYNPDFILANGIIIEAKGDLNKEDNRKMLAVKQQHPNLDIMFVFYEAGKKVPRSKETHSHWAERNGFKWADVTIPDEWLRE